MILEDAIKNREDCLKYLEGLGQKASPQNMEAVRWSVRALKFMQSPTLTPPNEWVSVEERLPEDEARQYIEDVLDGIGYLYPCLLTYKSGVQDKLLAALHIMSDGLYGIVDANFDRLMRDHGYDAPDESGEDKDVF